MTQRSSEGALFDEGSRQFAICNGCRYCENLCPVWDAMERRLDFRSGDLLYLANLCHDCRSCYEACPFTPPHEFKMNIPELLSTTRLETYRQYAWPHMFRYVFDHPIGATLALEGGSAAFSLVFALLYLGSAGLFARQSSIYAVFPEALLIVGGLALGGYVVLAALMGLASFWRDVHGPIRGLFNTRAFFYATYEVVIHKYFQGGGGGCSYPSKAGSYVRLPFHSLTFSGFLSAFIATLAAAINEHVFSILPPYSLASPPVLFGVAGGVAMVAGVSTLVFLKERSNKQLADSKMLNLDYAFVLVLELASVTGLLSLAFRDSSLFGSIVAIHMGTVIALFISAPYGKFIHYVYRYAALLKNQLEATKEET